MNNLLNYIFNDESDSISYYKLESLTVIVEINIYNPLSNILM